METRDGVIQYLDNYRKQLLEKRERLLRPLQELDQEIESVLTTLKSLQRSIAKIEIEPSASDDFPIAKIRKLTQVQALIVIAKHYDGIVRAQQAKRLLIRAGVMRETKNSTNIIHSVIIRSEKFEKVRPGEYKLKDAAASSTPKGEGALFTPIQ